MDKMASVVPGDPLDVERTGQKPRNHDASSLPTQCADSTISSQQKLPADLPKKIGSSQTTSGLAQSQLSQWGNPQTSESSIPINTNATADGCTWITDDRTRTMNNLSFQGQGGGNDASESSGLTLRPHTGGDIRWDAINAVSRGSPLSLNHFRLLKRIGYGDIGSVYLVELRGTGTHFAMKVMDKASLASRNKLPRSQMEKEILGLLDHPFLPTLYSYFETDKFYCLVMEFCSGGNLHSLRQKQTNKHFTEEAARCDLASLLLACFFLSP
ncbi:hypothetical protein MLD38_027049 [Melastoma candidum]|uniref:Uncharacterized protein n=1 Tax=Melastoma candidum TaxID=119954 RepID=A0ACB9P085_9MYRT|nr:hypothetical protein MLD38_027049 [Melastoma candidum]